MNDAESGNIKKLIRFPGLILQLWVNFLVVGKFFVTIFDTTVTMSPPLTVRPMFISASSLGVPSPGFDGPSQG